MSFANDVIHLDSVMKIILGSSSARRKEVLVKMGIPFEIMTADIDERAIRREDPKEMVLAIAKAKAEALLPRVTEPLLLITADGVVVCRDSVREKPENEEEARTFLREYRRYPAHAITAIVVTNTETGASVSEVVDATVFFKDFSDEAMEDMIEKGDALKCAGAFNVVDPYVAPYVERIDGTIEGVMGLSVEVTRRLLKEMGGSD